MVGSCAQFDIARLLLIHDDDQEAVRFRHLLDEHAGGAMVVAQAMPLHDVDAWPALANFDAIVAALRTDPEAVAACIARLRRKAPHIPLIALIDEPDPHDENAIQADAQWDLLSRECFRDGRQMVRLLCLAIERQRLRAKLEQHDRTLEQKQLQLSTILNTIKDAILVVDSLGTIQFANQSCGRVFGRDVGNLVGMPFGLPILPGPTNEIDIVYPGGGQGIAEVQLAEIVWGDHRANLVTLHDVTARKRGELAVRRANADLERKNQEMEQFVFVVSHDLKAPLVNMEMSAEELSRSIDEVDRNSAHDQAERIITNSRRMRQTIDDLLQLSRIGQTIADMESVDVSEVAREIVRDHYAQLIRAQNIDLDIQEAAPPVLADRERLRQLLDNLLGNAIKHGLSDDKRRIVVGVRQTPGETRLFVRDFGPGIDPIFHQKIFELFHRVSADKPGTGIGLAIVKRIAEVHGGRAWIESAPGDGATFWVALPSRTQAPLE